MRESWERGTIVGSEVREGDGGGDEGEGKGEGEGTVKVKVRVMVLWGEKVSFRNWGGITGTWLS